MARTSQKRFNVTHAPPTTPRDVRRAWDDRELADPHAAPDKAKRVKRMFAAIAPSYDLNNRLHSLGLDRTWRQAAVRAGQVKPTDIVLDVACGTGDLAMAFAQAGAKQVIGVDFTVAMLNLALKKQPATQAGHALSYQAGDAMRLPLADQSVDILSIAFGIRNVQSPSAALREFYRVLKPGGRLVILEFSLPRNALLRGLYNFYFRHVMPRTAAWIARDHCGAYRYLPQSVNTFLNRQEMKQRMREAGFGRLTDQALTFAIAVVYRAVKV